MSSVAANPQRFRILISYVHAEAEQHARRLKEELMGFQFDVFLDVDEILGGEDWIERLNSAVLNCELFIPLITPEYGEKKWTRRELTLADMKDKLIIPINFLDSWPPDCLAILFASTHYIPWKRAANNQNLAKFEDQTDRDIRVWEESVRSVANEISERFRRRRLNPVDPFIGRASLGMDNSSKPLIVISAHPAEKPFAEQLSRELSKSKLEIWSSTDSSIERIYSDSNNRMTPTVDGQTSNIRSPEEFDRGRFLKGRVNAASLVIIILSKKYCTSKTSKQQAYYCDLRKKVIAIKFNEFERPEWVSKMFDDDQVLEHTSQDIPSFMELINQRVSAAVKSNTKNNLPSITSNESSKTRDKVNDH